MAAALSACAPPDGAEEASADEAALTGADADDPSWDCYAPVPGHPTAAEREAFFADLMATATEAERTLGVPAAGILTLAAIEGGYGFTRVALSARNSFGYKWVGPESSEGRPWYTLRCQPEWDEGNQYVVFKSLREGMAFVAKKLATRADWANYKSVTDRYRAARRSGKDVEAAVDAWFDGIADEGYNYKPKQFKATLKAMARKEGLYRYSVPNIPGGGLTTEE